MDDGYYGDLSTAIDGFWRGRSRGKAGARIGILAQVRRIDPLESADQSSGVHASRISRVETGSGGGGGTPAVETNYEGATRYDATGGLASIDFGDGGVSLSDADGDSLSDADGDSLADGDDASLALDSVEDGSPALFSSPPAAYFSAEHALLALSRGEKKQASSRAEEAQGAPEYAADGGSDRAVGPQVASGPPVVDARDFETFRETSYLAPRPTHVRQVYAFYRGLYAVEPPPGRILDTTAHVGMDLLALARLFPRSHLTGIELDKKYFGALGRNVAQEGISDRTTLVQADFMSWLAKSCEDEGGPRFDLAYCDPPWTPDRLGSVYVEARGKKKVDILEVADRILERLAPVVVLKIPPDYTLRPLKHGHHSLTYNIYTMPAATGWSPAYRLAVVRRDPPPGLDRHAPSGGDAFGTLGGDAASEPDPARSFGEEEAANDPLAGDFEVLVGDSRGSTGNRAAPISMQASLSQFQKDSGEDSYRDPEPYHGGYGAAEAGLVRRGRASISHSRPRHYSPPRDRAPSPPARRADPEKSGGRAPTDFAAVLPSASREASPETEDAPGPEYGTFSASEMEDNLFPSDYPSPEEQQNHPQRWSGAAAEELRTHDPEAYSYYFGSSFAETPPRGSAEESHEESGSSPDEDAEFEDSTGLYDFPVHAGQLAPF